MNEFRLKDTKRGAGGGGSKTPSNPLKLFFQLDVVSNDGNFLAPK